MRTIIIWIVNRTRPAILVALVSVVAASAVPASCGGSAVESDRPTVVATTAVLGAVVQELVGEAARVTVLVPNGADPHDWEPSAKDVEHVNRATLVVANGLDLEEKLVEVLATAERDGRPVFRATDHLDASSTDGDPHFWTDPVAMAAVVAALSDELTGIGVEVDARADDLVDELSSLDAEIAKRVGSVPSDARVLVTGHESLGWFARRYGFELVGSIVPGLSTAADVTAANLAELRAVIERTGAPVIFTELGTPADVAAALADETGTRVVELATHLVPDDGSYVSFVRALAEDIVTALSATS